jgi:hypothetical protein
MKTTTRPLYIVAAVLPVAVVVLGLHWLCTGYKTFEDRGYDQYSFEYPASYWRSSSESHGPSGPSSVWIVGWPSFSNWMSNGNKIELVVLVESLHPEAPDADAMADQLLSTSRRELGERTTRTIAGKACEVLTFPDSYWKTALFEYNDREWELSVFSNPEYTEQANAVFEHAFNTFQLGPGAAKEASILALAVTPGSPEASALEGELETAVDSAGHCLIEGAPDAYPEWAGAQLSAPVPLYDLQDRLVCFMFEVQKGGEPLGTMTVASSLYINTTFDMKDAGQLPTYPSLSQVATIVEEDLGIRGSASDTPDRLLHLGLFNDVYAAYSIAGHDVAINLLTRRAVYVSDLEMRLPSPEQYVSDREQAAEAAQSNN